jgi:hypothetical protein
MSAKGEIRCGAPTDQGACTRRLRPGERCPDHGVLAPRDGSEPGPLAAEPCYCSRPIAFADDFEIRCIRCGHAVASNRQRVADLDSGSGSPPPSLLGEQLELDV